MPQCPKCRYRFRVMEDENPADFGCDRCGYGQGPKRYCVYCNDVIDDEFDDSEFNDYCSSECEINAANEENE